MLMQNQNWTLHSKIKKRCLRPTSSEVKILFLDKHPLTNFWTLNNERIAKGAAALFSSHLSISKHGPQLVLHFLDVYKAGILIFICQSPYNHQKKKRKQKLQTQWVILMTKRPINTFWGTLLLSISHDAPALFFHWQCSWGYRESA